MRCWVDVTEADLAGADLAGAGEQITVTGQGSCSVQAAPGRWLVQRGSDGVLGRLVRAELADADNLLWAVPPLLPAAPGEDGIAGVSVISPAGDGGDRWVHVWVADRRVLTLASPALPPAGVALLVLQTAGQVVELRLFAA